MREQGWKPVEARSCTGKVDADGRPVSVWMWMKTVETETGARYKVTPAPTL